MTRRPLGGRSLAVVRDTPIDPLIHALSGIPGVVVIGQSEPRYCVVCRERRMACRWLRWRRWTATSCPHCQPAPGYRALTVVLMPTRQDIPREDSAA